MARKKKEQETGLEHGSEFVPSRLRPMDIQQQEFRTSMRGYDPREVDEFLDRLTEDFAAIHDENKRLREGDSLGISGEAGSEADDMVRRARAEADAILRDARARAASGGNSGGDPLGTVWPFLSTERDFLRSLASMVQEHAEGIKRQAHRLQESAARAKASVPEAASPPPADPTRTAPAKTDAKAPSVWTATGAGSSDVPEPVTIPPSSVDTPPSSGGSGDRTEEPSLRDLFWGES